MMCDNCGELPATVPLGSLLRYCEPCAEETYVEFAVDLGYISRGDADAQLAEVARMRDTMGEEAA